MLRVKQRKGAVLCAGLLSQGPFGFAQGKEALRLSADRQAFTQEKNAGALSHLKVRPTNRCGRFLRDRWLIGYTRAHGGKGRIVLFVRPAGARRGR